MSETNQEDKQVVEAHEQSVQEFRHLVATGLSGLAVAGILTLSFVGPLSLFGHIALNLFAASLPILASVRITDVGHIQKRLRPWATEAMTNLLVGASLVALIGFGFLIASIQNMAAMVFVGSATVSAFVAIGGTRYKG